MFARSTSPSDSRPRSQALDDISRAMERFDLIVRVLQELEQSEVPKPGDMDIRHGCERALTAILVELAHIEPAATDLTLEESRNPLNKLYQSTACQLIDSDQLLRMEQFIKRILGIAPIPT